MGGRAALLILLLGAPAVAVACTRGGSAASDAGPAASGSATASGPLLPSTPSGLPRPGFATAAPDGRATITSNTAQNIGTRIAMQRWPQHHIKMVTAVHFPTLWRVVFQFDDDTGGHLILDPYGDLVDGGTSSGDHL